jgi:hypothetical protein
MPLLEVEIVAENEKDFAPDLPQKIADSVGHFLGSEPGHTWVKLLILPNTSSENTPFPIFVSILRATLPVPAEMDREIQGLTRTIGAICNRPTENVHILYLPQASGRLAFGGRLVREEGHQDK